MPIRQPGPGQMNKRGLPSAYQQFETPPAPSLGSQAVTAIKDRFVQGFTEPIKRTMAPLYGGPQPSMEDVTQATASMLPVGGLRIGKGATTTMRTDVLNALGGTNNEQKYVRSTVRYRDMLDRMKKYGYEGNIIDPPVVELRRMPNGGLKIEDGNHRVAAAYDAGIDEIPVKINEELLDKREPLFKMQPASRLREAKE